MSPYRQPAVRSSAINFTPCGGVVPSLPSTAQSKSYAGLDLGGGRAFHQPTPPPPLGAQDLVDRARAGDRGALEALLRKYQPLALQFVRRAHRRGQPADWEDILQRVLIVVSRNITKFEARSSFTTWLHAICTRVAKEHRRPPRGPVCELSFCDEEGELLREEAADPAPSPELVAESAELAAHVRSLVDRLSPKKRTVLVLHDLEGVSPKEIAKLVGAPVLTVRTRLFYARRQFAALAARDPALQEAA